MRFDFLTFYSSLLEPPQISESISHGVLVKGSLSHIFHVFTELAEDGILNSKSLFLDTGSGDGRICVLASLLGYKSYGIELNKLAYEFSLSNIEKLSDNKILERNIPIIKHGNFFDDSVYTELGVPFSNFDIIFTFHQDLAKKIEVESQPGTILILHFPMPTSFNFDGLKLVKKIDIHDNFQRVYVFRKN